MIDKKAVCVAQTAKHCFAVMGVIGDRIYGRYPSRPMAERRVKQIETSRRPAKAK